jgi:RNA polymerase sigma-70 factor (ECF subfamily)
VLVLTVHAERSALDVGRELALSSGNVRVIRHRALARLRACLEGEEAMP